MLGLRTSFNHCNQKFMTEVEGCNPVINNSCRLHIDCNHLKQLHHTLTAAVVEAVWMGCCKSDLIRPTGEVVVKGNGRDFVAHVCFVVEVDVQNGITKIDEYYNKPWWDGVGEDEYLKMQGASLKT